MREYGKTEVSNFDDTKLPKPFLLLDNGGDFVG